MRETMAQMHWDISKLLSLGVDEQFLKESDITPDQARGLVKGILFLRERYNELPLLLFHLLLQQRRHFCRLLGNRHAGLGIV